MSIYDFESDSVKIFSHQDIRTANFMTISIAAGV